MNLSLLDANEMTTAQISLHVEILHVSTLVLKMSHVHPMQIVELSGMNLFARVLMDTLVHQKLSVNYVSVRSEYLLTHYVRWYNITIIVNLK